MGRGERQEAVGGGLLYGPRQARQHTQKSEPLPLTLNLVKKQLKRLGFKSQESVGIDGRWALPQDLASVMERQTSTLYAHPNNGELRLMIYPLWESDPPTLATSEMQHLCRKLMRSGLGDLMLEFELEEEQFEQLTSLVDPSHLQLTSSESLEDERSEAEVLSDLCERAEVEQCGRESLAELFDHYPEAVSGLFYYQGELSIQTSVSALARGSGR